MSTSISSANIDDQKKGIFSQIPNELIFDQILCYFEYYWILRRARLVCKYWNDQHKTIKINQFKISYKGNIEKISLMMNEHPDELLQVTELIFYETNESKVEMERLFISKLINLQKLTLFAEYCDISIIQEIAKLRNLKKVYLCNSYYFEEFIKCPSKIKSITINGNTYATVSDIDFSDLNWPLEKLIIHCPLSSKSIISLLKNETMTKNLKKLEVSNSELDENVMKEISTLSRLRKLDLAFAKCRDVGAQYISELESLEFLNLYNNSINGSGLCNFRNLTNITKLNLNNNYIDNEGANYLSSVTSLNYLYLGNNKISDEGLKNYCKLSNLLELNLDHNEIGNIGANYLSQITNITCLNLNNNLIGEEGLKNFGNLSELETLFLENNQIGNGFQYLSNCKQIENLHVSNNNIHGEAVIKFSENNPTCIKTLFISDNPVGSSGFISLVTLPQLKIIDAKNCKVFDKGILKMLEILPSKTCKISLYLWDNKITNKSLKQLIKHTDKIEELFLSNKTSELEVKYLNILSRKLDNFKCENWTDKRKLKNSDIIEIRFINY